MGVVILKWRKKLISINESVSRDFAMKELTPPPQGSEIRCEVTITSQVHHKSDPKSLNLSSPRSTHVEESEVPDAIRDRYPAMQQPSFQGTQTTIVAARPPIRTLDANKATLSYCKTALLFFFALLCTWYVTHLTLKPCHSSTCLTLPQTNSTVVCCARVPSTINRVHALIRPDADIFGFDLASSLVLPLQGFWNFIIYTVTSFAACKAMFQRFRSGLFGSRHDNLHVHSKPRQTSSLTLSKHNRRSLGSDDTRAEIAIGFEAKNRSLHHNYTNRSSTDDEILIQGTAEPAFDQR